MFFDQPASFVIFSASTWVYMLWTNVQVFGVLLTLCMPLTWCGDKCSDKEPAGCKGGFFVSCAFYMAFYILMFLGSFLTPLPVEGSTWVPMSCEVIATGIAGETRKASFGPRVDAYYCSPEGFEGYTGITCDEHSQMEARHWMNASLPCWDSIDCRYSVWAFVALHGHVGSQERCAYDDFRAVTQTASWQDMNFAEHWHTACMKREQLIGSTMTCWLNQRDNFLSLRNMPAAQDEIQTTRNFGLYGSIIGLMVPCVLLWKYSWSLYRECYRPRSMRVWPTFGSEPLNP